MKLVPDKPASDHPIDKEIFDLEHECFWDIFVLGRGQEVDDPELDAKLQRLQKLREQRQGGDTDGES